MEYKLNKDRKIINGRYVECIVLGCKNKPYSEGLCLEHYKQEREEEVVDDTQSDLYGDRGED